MTHFISESPTIEDPATLVLHGNTPGLSKYKPYPPVSVYPGKQVNNGYIGQKNSIRFSNSFLLIAFLLLETLTLKNLY